MIPLKAIGLMSGTSFDGVDAALLESDGITLSHTGPTIYRPYSGPERDLLRRALADACVLADRTERPGALAEAERVVTETHAETVERLFKKHRINRTEIAIVGFHGQTVLHRPASRLTVQIGDGPGLARRLGIPVAYDFRAADVAAGGQGAPLVPIYHKALAATLDGPRPVAVLNIGGVANVTYVDGTDFLLAFDTGPGNALLDDFMHARTGEPRDENGAAAKRGTADRAIIAQLRSHPFFALPPPKSLDRNAFAGLDLSAMTVPDGAATLTMLTVETIAAARDHLPRTPRSWIVAGGGARNPTLMAMLAARLAPDRVLPAGAVGWSGDAMEAQAFAYLALRTLQGAPITFPGTTGVGRPMPGGVVARAQGQGPLD